MSDFVQKVLSAGKILYAEGYTENSADLFREVIKVDPLNVEAHINLGYALCRMYNYVEGCRELTWIWRPVFGDQSEILSLNENLAGKVVLLSADAGLGDSIMFARYATALKERGCTVIMQVQPALVRLIELSELADQVIATNQTLPDFDVRVPFHNIMAALSLPGDFFGFGPSKYLNVDLEEQQKYLELISSYRGRKVGLCWRGNPSLPDDSKRSISLEKILNFTTPGDQLFSLVPDDCAVFNRGIHQFEFKDIASTAALIKCLDLVITVDTMVCHLAGALGVKTLLLNRRAGCWRWGDHRTSSNYYSSVSIASAF